MNSLVLCTRSDYTTRIQILGSRSNNMPYIPAPPPVHRPIASKPIHIPSNADLPRPQRPFAPEGDGEAFDMNGADFTPEYHMSAQEAEKALRDLMADVRTDEKVEIHDEDTIVPGFRDGIVLMPHQVVARSWMKERETGKRSGGILADDMGYVFVSSRNASD